MEAKELVKLSQLPAKVNRPRGININEQYSLMGIKVIGKTKDNKLFLDVELPEGWRKEVVMRTSSMKSFWTILIDDKGGERANLFFYDRWNAFVNFNTRYFWDTKYYDEKFKNGVAQTFIVKDRATGEILFEGKKHDWRNSRKYEGWAIEFLKITYPDYENINAYWD